MSATIEALRREVAELHAVRGEQYTRATARPAHWRVLTAARAQANDALSASLHAKDSELGQLQAVIDGALSVRPAATQAGASLRAPTECEKSSSAR